MVRSKTIFTGDNLEVMRGMVSDSVDLIYLDPPFNSNHNYAAPIGSEAAGAEFTDTWTLDDVDVAWHGEIAEGHEGLYDLINATGKIHGDSMQSYLIYMAVRVMEMKRLLKSTGSIYLHCDPTASHYLKVMMDEVFGRKNFRNEIVWGYEKPRSAKRTYRRNHDTVFFYTASDKWTFNPQRVPTLDGKFEMRKPFKRPDGTYWHPKAPGKQAGSWWYDIASFATRMTAKERTGYPTQKPLKLLERIIKASSNPGDLVLDPFCGCATTCVAAERLGRQWVGIDVSEKAADLIRVRLKKELGLFGRIIHRTDKPKRGGTRTKNIKHIRFGEQEGRCAICNHGFPFRNLEADHIVPTSKGGPDIDENIQLLCGHCNRVKGNRLDNAETKVRLEEMGVI